MIYLKPGVVTDGLSFQMGVAIGAAVALKRELFRKDMTITSGHDSTHNPGSKHYKGEAIDIRSVDLTPEQVHVYFDALNSALDPLGFDVVLEGAGATAVTTAPHIHIEWDPKTGEQLFRVST
jgi:hypothetical protein